MDMKGEYRIPAPREKVWEALNDPEILKACIPGCESLEMTSGTQMNASVTVKVGPVKAKFKGEVTLENLNPPEGYSIVGEGKGGVAGFAKGGADVHLEADGDETILTYEAKAQVGGKLAQLGSRLIDSTARKMAEDFFGKFSAAVGGQDAASTDGLAAATGEAVTGQGEHSIAGETAEVENAMEASVIDAEEKLEIAAGKGVLGGPMAWGFIALGVLIAIIMISNM